MATTTGGGASGVEQQLDALWEQQARSRKFRRIEDMNQEMNAKVEEEVEKMQSTVQDKLAEDRARRRKKLEELAKMETDFVAGVELWKRKSYMSIEDLTRAQSDLQERVAESSSRMAGNKRQLRESHEERLGQLKETCARLVERCKRQIDTSSEL